MSTEQNPTTLSPAVLANQSANDDAYQKLKEVLQHARTLTLVLSITMVVALVGNLFLAFLILKMSRRRMGPVQILILHTCIADICFALCTALPQMASTLTFPYFYGGDFLCRLVKYLQLIPMFASPYLLVAISIDRYVAICKPLSALRWKYRLVHTLAGLAWAAALVFSTPNIFLSRYDVIENTRIEACMFQMDEEFEKAWIGIFSLIVWLAPTIIVAVLYTFVCVTVWKSMRRVDKHVGSSSLINQRDDLSASTTEGGSVSGNRRNSCGADYDYATTGTTITMRKTFTPTINSYKVKTVKLTMTIVVANFVLWAPFCITNVISTYFRNVQIDVMLTTCIMLVGNANSCVNPWIYVVFNYKRVWEVLCGGDQRQNSSSRNRGTALIKTTPTVRHKKSAASIDNGHHYQHQATSSDNDRSSPTPNFNQIRNSRRQNSQRRFNSGAATTTARRLSQTSVNSSYSAF